MSLYEQQYPTEVNWENYPNTSTPLSRNNLRHMDSGITAIDQAVMNAINTLEITKGDADDVNISISDVSLDTDTGTITFTRVNGQTFTVETALSKVATNWQYDSTNQFLVLTLADGTTQNVNLSALIQNNEFLDTSTIAFTVSNDGKVSANVVGGSITSDKLQPNYLADITTQASNAASSATSSQNYSRLAESYAHGGTNLPSRPTENVDNALYYKNLALQAAQDAQAFSGLYDFTPPTSTAPGTRGLVPRPPQKTNVPKTLTEDGWTPNDAARIPYDTGYLNAYMPVYKDFVVGTDGTLTTATGTQDGFSYAAYLVATWSGMTVDDSLAAVAISGYTGNFGVLPAADTLTIYFETAPSTGDTIRVFKTKGVEDPEVTSTVGGVVVTTGMIAGMIATVEPTSTAAEDHAIGDFIIYDGLFRLVTADIDAGDTIVPGTAGTPGTNVTTDTIGVELSNILRKVKSITPRVVGTKLIFGGGD